MTDVDVYFAVVAQLVEHRIGSAEVTGPNPVNSLGVIFTAFAALHCCCCVVYV